MKQFAIKVLPVILAAIVIVGSGVVHGLMTDRWRIDSELMDAAHSLSTVSPTIGDWASEPVDISARQLEQAEAKGHLSRRFVNQKTGESITVMILCGRPGPISVHPPTVCFTGAGWGLPAEPRRISIENATGSPVFWVGDFVKASATSSTSMRTYWAWNAVGEWETPDNPRMTFARHPLLYKIYVMRGLRRNSPETENDPAIDFMTSLLQELDSKLKTAS